MKLSWINTRVQKSRKAVTTGRSRIIYQSAGISFCIGGHADNAKILTSIKRSAVLVILISKNAKKNTSPYLNPHFWHLLLGEYMYQTEKAFHL